MTNHQLLLKGLITSLLAILTLFSCVPIRKQLLVTDPNKNTLPKKQIMDTVVDVTPYIYKIHSGDILSIKVKSVTPGEYKLDDVSSNGGEAEVGYLVRDSGYVDIPVIGLIKVAGLTINQCRDSLKVIASQFLNNVVVNVQFLSFEVAVVGELNARVKSPDGRLNVLQALAFAGWSKEFANLSRIKIIRELEHNKMHVYYIDVSDIGIISKPEFYLMPRDIVAVEPRRAKNFTNTRTLIAFGVSMLSLLVLVYNLKNIIK
jgi:polysaccharide export outer membrane protein